MVLKVIDASAARPGTAILIDGDAYTVRSNDHSKTGKHGAGKCRIEAIGIISGNKKILAVPDSDRFEVPLIEKKKAQVLSVSDDKASVMDLTSYETIELPFMAEVKADLAAEKQVEYWDIEGKQIIMRVF